MGDVLGVGPDGWGVNRREAGAPRFGAYLGGKLGCPQPRKKPAAHRAIVELAQRPAIGVRQDGLAAVLCGDALEARSNFVERLVPSNALEDLRSPCGADTPVREPFRSHPLHRIPDAVRRLKPIPII